MNCFSKLLFGTLTAVAVLAPPVASALPFDRLVIFGDSLADTGNAAVLIDSGLVPGIAPRTRTSTPILTPGSPDLVAGAPYQSDRLSNGPVWVDDFAASLGLSATHSLSLHGGTNYAIGGAKTGPASSFTSLLGQVSTFLALSGGAASSNSLYVIEGGGNDARSAITVRGRGDDEKPLVSDYASNIGTILTLLTAAGADEFLLANVPDASKAPEVLLGPHGADALALTVSMEFNAALSAELGLLTPSLPSGVHIHILDLFGLLDRIVADPPAFNLTDATSVCAASQQCIDNPDQTFFWDGIHPTTAGHALIAQEALAVIQGAPAAIPEPGTLLLMAFGVMSLISFTPARRRGSALPSKPISAAA